jgi:hypothetical protein
MIVFFSFGISVVIASSQQIVHGSATLARLHGWPSNTFIRLDGFLHPPQQRAPTREVSQSFLKS